MISHTGSGRALALPAAHRWRMQAVRNFAALAAFALPIGLAAQGTGELWEVTSKMEIAGLPMAMPSQTNRRCLAKDRRDEDTVPRGENCQVSDARRAGNKLTFRMDCTGNDPLSGTGEITYGGNAYDGRIRLNGKMEGQPMAMTQIFSGRRVGDCANPR
jgi:hypothetical protein